MDMKTTATILELFLAVFWIIPAAVGIAGFLWAVFRAGKPEKKKGKKDEDS